MKNRKRKRSGAPPISLHSAYRSSSIISAGCYNKTLPDELKQRALAHPLAGNPLFLRTLAEELRLAQAALSDITGEFSSDDLLGVIFSSFCIGK